MSNNPQEDVVRHIIETIGHGALMRALGVGTKAIERALYNKRLTASWIPVVRTLYQEAAPESEPWQEDWERTAFTTRPLVGPDRKSVEICARPAAAAIDARADA